MSLLLAGGMAAQESIAPENSFTWLAEEQSERAVAGFESAAANSRADRGFLQSAANKLLADASIRGKRLLVLLDAVAARLAVQAPGVLDRFGYDGARRLIRDQQVEGALRLLRRADAACAKDASVRFYRLMLEVDLLLSLERLALVATPLARLRALDVDEAQRTAFLSLESYVHTQFGRLGRAARGFQRAQAAAQSLVAAASGAEDRLLPYYRSIRLDVWRRSFDLLGVQRDHEGLRRSIQQYRDLRTAESQAPSAREEQLLTVFECHAAYLAALDDAKQCRPAAARLQALLAKGQIDPRSAGLLRLWLVDLTAQAGDLDDAKTELAALTTEGIAPDLGWKLDVLSAYLANLSGDRAEQRRLVGVLRALLAKRIDSWRRLAELPDAVGHLRFGTRLRVLGELVTAIADLDGPSAALQPVLDVQRCTQLADARGAQPLDVSALQRRLPVGTGVLVYAVVWQSSHLFLVDRDGVSHHRLTGMRRLREGSRALQAELAALDGLDVGQEELADVRDVSRGLCRQLLPDAAVARMAGWRHVYVSGAGLLGAPPFAALELADGKLMGERFATTTISSLPLLVRLQQDRALGRGAAAADLAKAPRSVCVATLDPGPVFRRDVAVEPAASTLAATLWRELGQCLPADTRVAFGADATVAKLEGFCAEPNDLTVVLAHGAARTQMRDAALGLAMDARDVSVGLASADLLADPAADSAGAAAGGLLSAPRIRALQHSGIVAMAACFGARGPLRMGNDTVADTLVGAWLHAGAHAVVASPAPLRLGVYRDVLPVLLRELQQGVSVAEALRRARVADGVGGGGDRLRAFRLAQLEAYGDGGRCFVSTPVPGRGPYGWLWLAAPLGALVLLMLVLRRGSRKQAPAPFVRG
ncbi:MAG: CHAT domain-containing protein [Planctomycetota bacterium]